MVEVGGGVSVAGTGVFVARNESMTPHDASSSVRRFKIKIRLKVIGFL